KVVTAQQGRSLRVGAAAVAALASRLGERDRLVALACYEHRVLTTEQVRRLHFRSSRRCRACLDLDRTELRWRHQAAIAISRSGKLAHQLEVNEFFTRLTEQAATTGGRL